MNKSDLSEDDHNNTSKSHAADAADLDADDAGNSKYVPPKSVPLSEIWNKDADDPSLNKYKQQLIGSAINIILG
jgi:hypothetical protein